MPLNSFRRALGHSLGEVIFAAIFASGLIMALTFVLNGFDPMATARFLDNFTGRLLAASPERLRRFAWIAGTSFAGLMALIALIRAADRCRPRPTPSLKGRTA